MNIIGMNDDPELVMTEAVQNALIYGTGFIKITFTKGALDVKALSIDDYESLKEYANIKEYIKPLQ
jgi:hypothetical protein